MTSALEAWPRSGHPVGIRRLPHRTPAGAELHGPEAGLAVFDALSDARLENKQPYHAVLANLASRSADRRPPPPPIAARSG